MSYTLEHSRSQLRAMFSPAPDDSSHSTVSSQAVILPASRVSLELPNVNNLIGTMARVTGPPVRNATKVSRGVKPTILAMSDSIIKEKPQLPHSPLHKPDLVPPKGPTDHENVDVTANPNSFKSSNPRAFIHRFTTKLRTPSLPTRQAVRPPALTNSIVSRGQREAALRERGLLPPLPIDLSVLENERDTELGPLASPDLNSDGDTPANKIMQDWKAKNDQVSENVPEGESHNFKSGELPPLPEESSSIDEITPFAEAELPPTSKLELVTQDPPPPPTKTPPPTDQVKFSETAVSPENKPLPPSPSSDAPKPTRSSPPAPLNLTTDANICSPFHTPGTGDSVYFTPPPHSPSQSSSSSSSPSPSRIPGDSTPKVLDSQQLIITPTPPSITIVPSDSPPVLVSLEDARSTLPSVGSLSTRTRSCSRSPPPSSPSSPVQFSSATWPRKKSSPGLPSLSESDSGVSIITPSSSVDDYAVQTPDVVTGVTSNAPQLTLQLNLDGFAAELGNIPAIVESPVEEGGVHPVEVDMKIKVNDDDSRELPEEDQTPAVSTLTLPSPPPPPPPGQTEVHSRQRGLTDPGTKPTRKSLMFFRREKMTSQSSSPGLVGAQGPRSFTGLRSMVGSLSRAKTKLIRTNAPLPLPAVVSEVNEAVGASESESVDTGAGPDAARSSWRSSLSLKRVLPTDASPASADSTRQPVSPTMCNAGTILQGLAGVQDEESKKLTEVAYL